uniref:hypothetical protein n=1 Tax=Flavobacterium sp. TaxID=239 RepID=UPI00404AD246
MFSKKYLLYSFVSILSLGFIACTGDDEPVDPLLLDNPGIVDGGGNVNNNTVFGVYVMTAFNSSVPIDLNGDGVSSTNSFDETECFDNSFLTLNQNNTFIANSKGIEINFDFDLVTGEEISTIECFTDESANGTWAVDGTNVVFTSTQDGETFTDTFAVVGNTLVFTVEEGSIVGTTNQGTPAYLTSQIQIIYTKQ